MRVRTGRSVKNTPGPVLLPIERRDAAGWDDVAAAASHPDR